MLNSHAGSVRFLVLILLLASAAYWYRNYFRAAPKTETAAGSAPAAAPSPPPAPAAPEPTYDNPGDYARKYVSFAGVLEGKLDRPGLILKFSNAGDKDVSNLSVKVMGYRDFYVPDPSRAEGTEYVVDLEVKSFPAKKVTETVLYFPAGVQSIGREIKVHDASF